MKLVKIKFTDGSEKELRVVRFGSSSTGQPMIHLDMVSDSSWRMTWNVGLVPADAQIESLSVSDQVDDPTEA